MVVSDAKIHNIMGGMESTAGVRLHNHRRKLKQRFDIIKKLGQGTYGKVQLGINKETGQEVAIKTIKKAKIETEADLVRIRREIQIMSSVQHPNIIHIYEVFENREKMVLVMEYAAGGELYDFLSEKKVLAEHEARRIFRQIATAVYYCHKHKICHRDLKLENILLDEHGSAKIADFGLSNVFNDHSLLSTFCGSPLYASPEIVKGTPYLGPEVDCWSLGVLLYTLVYGAMPFDGSNFKRLVKQISQGDYFEPKKPSPASPLIREMLTVTPARRANIEKICSHWWVNEGHTESCLDIAEELANQTPVRLDLLLSLAPPPSSDGNEIVVPEEKGAGAAPSDAVCPTRCRSVGSLMDFDQPAAERKVQEFERQKQKGNVDSTTTKRKLEEGVSADAIPSEAKKKELSRKQDSEKNLTRKSSSVASSSQAKAIYDVQEQDENAQADEKMDVDMDTPDQESLGAAAPIVQNDQGHEPEGAAALVTEVPSQKTPEKVVAAASIGRDRVTRKSVKGSTKKSKPSAASTDSVPSNTKVSQSQDIQDKVTTEQVEKSTGETANESPSQPEVLPIDVNKEKDKVEQPTESVKETVKKKKKVPTSITEDINVESLQKKADDVVSSETTVPGSTLNSSQDSKTESNADVSKAETSGNKVSNNSTTSLKEIDQNKSEVTRTGSVKSRKPLQLNLNKTKSSGSADVGGPAKPVERRRSKIFENSEQFNIFLKGSEPKSPGADKAKKVFIPGVKVSDFKQAFERRSSLASSASTPTSPLPDKNSSSKKPVAPKLKSSSKNSSSETSYDGSEGTSTSEQLPLLSDKQQESLPSNNNVSSTENNAVPNSSSIEQSACVPESESSEVKTVQENKYDSVELKLEPALQVTDKTSQQEKAKVKKLKAVEIISNAISEECKKELVSSSDKKTPSSKPPVPISEKMRKKSTTTSPSSKSPPMTPSEKKTIVPLTPSDVRPHSVDVSSLAQALKSATVETNKPLASMKEPDVVKKSIENITEPEEAKKKVESEAETTEPTKKKSNKVEITLKSATLPRRKTSKAEIQLGFPPSKVPVADTPGEYRTEVEHMVGNVAPSRLQTQRSEVAFPVAAATNIQPLSVRSSSLEPEGTPKHIVKPREHIIPIQLEDGEERSKPPPAKPPVPPMQQQRSLSHQRSSSLSRQSTQDSDTDSTISASGPEPIRKSPREFIIPIAVEGGGYITPRAGSLEPSASEASTEPPSRHHRHSSRSRLRKISSLLSDSEDEGFNSPYATLQRHSSIGREGDIDDERPFQHMHRLRSSKPRRATLEHNDSLSSAEEEDDDDDDDGFEILTAESLFSTLLSRVRSLTQRLNVEDGGRSGFPSSRLMSHLASAHSPSSSFWSNAYGFPGEPISRRVSESSQFSRPESQSTWRRSASRDISDAESVYSDADTPRGSSRYDCSPLSESDQSSHYYTPGLSKRLQRWSISNQNLSNLSTTPEEYHSSMRKSSLGSLSPQSSNIPQQRLSRTLSLHSKTDDKKWEGRRPRDVQTSPSPSLSRCHSTRNDYLPLSRRSVSMLDTKINRSLSGIPTHRSSSITDSTGCYSPTRTLDERVLPPLPYNPRGRDRRKESLKSPVFSSQRSLDISSGVHSVGRQTSRSSEENVRPHHSTSLPTMSGTKGKKICDVKKIPEESKHEDNSFYDALVENNEHQTELSSSVSTGSSRIPSLSRSSSLRRAREKDGNSSSHKREDSTTRVKRSDSVSSTPDRSILSKFLRQPSEERDTSKTSESTVDDNDPTKRKRRISRFLRPDFFDTPREESIYAKEKDAKKKSETEKNVKQKSTDSNSLKRNPNSENNLSNGKEKSIDKSNLLPKSIDESSLKGKSIDKSNLLPKSIDESSLKGKSIDKSNLLPKSIDESSLKGKSIDKSNLLPKSIDENSLKQKSLNPTDTNSLKRNPNGENNLSNGKEKPIDKSNLRPKSTDESSLKLKSLNPNDSNSLKRNPNGENNLSSGKEKPIDKSKLRPKSTDESSLKQKSLNSTDANSLKCNPNTENNVNNGKEKPIGKNTLRPKSADESSLKQKFQDASDLKQKPTDENKLKQKPNFDSNLKPKSNDKSNMKQKPIGDSNLKQKTADESNIKQNSIRESNAELNPVENRLEQEHVSVVNSKQKPTDENTGNIPPVPQVQAHLIPADKSLNEPRDKPVESTVPEGSVTAPSVSNADAPTPESSKIQSEKEVKVTKKKTIKATKSSDDSKGKNVKNTETNSSSPSLEKQTSESSNKSGFLHSLEKKLEKFRSSSDNIPSTNNSGKSRVDKAIRSLREQSLSRGDEVTTENHLLKRAVSVDDVSKNQPPSKDSSPSKLGSKINSVLGLFKKFEDKSPKSGQSPPKSSALPQMRRTQSVYAGSHSDSMLLEPKLDNPKSKPSSSLKKINMKSKSQSRESVSVGKEMSGTDKISDLQPSNSPATVDPLPTVASCINGSVKTLENTQNTIVPDAKDGEKNTPEVVQGECSAINSHLENKNKTRIKQVDVTDKTVAHSNHISIPGERGGVKLPKLTNLQTSATGPNAGTSGIHLDRPRELNLNIKNPNKIPTADVEASFTLYSKNNSDKIGSSHATARNDTVITLNANVDCDTLNNTLPVEINSSPCEDYAYNDDEIRFANMKQLDTCSTPGGGEEFSLLSPADESESFDSWSVCSDIEGRELPASPIPPLGDEVEESVGERIRRKSFYSRFNDIKKKHRKSSLSSIGSLSSSYKEPSLSKYHSSSRKDYNLHPSHSFSHQRSSHSGKSEKNTSAYGQSNRIPIKSQHSHSGESNASFDVTVENHHGQNNNLENDTLVENSLWDSSQGIKTSRNESASNIGRSMETLKMPRHFNSNIGSGVTSYRIPTYSGPVRRASDSHLARSIDSNIGIIPRSQFQTPSSSRFLGASTDLRLGDTSPVHSNYKRFNLEEPMESSSYSHIALPTSEEVDS